MAADTERTNNDSVSISRKTYGWLAGLASAAFIGAGGALYSINNDVVRLTEVVGYLKEFASVGGRFTADNGREMKAEILLMRTEIQELRTAMHKHDARDWHSVAGSEIQGIKSDLKQCCRNDRWDNGVNDR